ncbi:MAG: NAD(P)H-dependent oxidoreductase [Candidatus Obscuribacterales bacterium]|nr:NAD(P)H-dependent oxidoreductase [Candidatus Obscuribacterales bacterium]
MDKLLIPILLGTNRKERQSEHVAKWLLQEVQQRKDIETVLFDARDFSFPTDDYGTEIKDLFPQWRDTMGSADGLIIVAPEYNHGCPGLLKSILDVLLKEYIHKAVGLVGVSGGPWGGTRVIESLVPVVRELGLAVIFTDLNFAHVQDQFNDKGNIKDATTHNKRAKAFLDELVWMSAALRWGRTNLNSSENNS